METDRLPTIGAEATMKQALVLLAERRGIAIVTEGQRLVGLVTSGDLTRLLEREPDALSIPVSRVMTRTPQVARDDELGSAAVHRMEKHGIIAMPVLNAEQAVVGVVHLHDLMRAGVS
jgi:arabinose-5-phosphate isomerase